MISASNFGTERLIIFVVPACTFKIFAGVSALSPDNSEKTLVKQMNEAMNVSIEWNCVAGDTLTEKKNLILNTTSDLPDALMGADLTDYEQIMNRL